MKRLNKFILLLVLVCAMLCGGCSKKPTLPPLDEGRCRENADCEAGYNCNNTWCEDIYHPRRKIKPY